MATPEQITTMALNLVGQAVSLLETGDDEAGAKRLRHAAAVIRHDHSFSPVADGLQTPMSLMRMALALMDKDGRGTSHAACHLQAAVDAARDAKPLGPDNELDPAFLLQDR